MRVTVKEGQTLWEALQQSGVSVERPCAGTGICGGCRVKISGEGEVLSCRWTTPGEYEVTLPQEQTFSSVFSNETLKAGAKAVAAVDIGTTTVAIVMAYEDREVRCSFTNPQRIYGADVLSRIRAANSSRDAQRGMRDMLTEKMEEALAAGMRQLEAEGDLTVFLAANTTMMHILRGFSCEGLGRAPFTPVTLEYGREEKKVDRYTFSYHFLPGISAFIGADIVSGIFGLRLLEEKKKTMLIDLGTNGELAVCDGTQILCASTAAGPAFEGSELAMKIHAAGILKSLHEMMKEGVIDAYGTLREPYFTEGYPVSFQGENAAVKQDDIREIQMAKGAIRAGIELLLQEAGVSPDELDVVYLAGGMGYYLEAQDAAAIGLLPEQFAKKAKTVGNSAMMGLIRLADESADGAQKWREELQQIADSAEELVLAEHSEFEERYLAAMNFPE